MIKSYQDRYAVMLVELTLGFPDELRRTAKEICAFLAELPLEDVYYLNGEIVKENKCYPKKDPRRYQVDYYLRKNLLSSSIELWGAFKDKFGRKLTSQFIEMVGVIFEKLPQTIRFGYKEELGCRMPTTHRALEKGFNSMGYRVKDIFSIEAASVHISKPKQGRKKRQRHS